MGAGHDHSHSQSVKNRKRLLVTLLLTSGYMVAEFLGGMFTGSLALMADAGHMLSDVIALALSFVAVWLAQRPVTVNMTFGYRRSEILAALINGISLVAIAVFICIEAIERFKDPREIQAPIMLLIAIGGLIVNLIGLRILHGGKQESLNIRGAWLHVLTDTLGSVGAAICGILIWAFGWNWADTVVSIIIALLVMYSSYFLLKESLSVILEGVPSHLDPKAIREFIRDRSEVSDVHDFHLWTITSGHYCLSTHVVTNEDVDTQLLLRGLKQQLSEQFGINHATIQIEWPTCMDSATCN